MNMDKKDWEEVRKSIDSLLETVGSIWIDRDYSSELTDREKVVQVISDTQAYIRRYFRGL